MEAAPKQKINLGKKQQEDFATEYILYGWVQSLDIGYEVKIFLSASCINNVLSEVVEKFDLTIDWVLSKVIPWN